MSSNTERNYPEMVDRIRTAACQALPSAATVAVVSKGDAELLDLGSRRAWHFPQRDDGMYAGYYPEDSAAAIAHLEELRTRGAEYILFPHHALWWLEHYGDFRRHLESRYRAIVSDDQVCVIYALSETAVTWQPEVVLDSRVGLPDLVPKERQADLAAIFDTAYYAEQTGRTFASLDAAVLHYVQAGAASGLNPHPLFDTGYYLSRYPEVRVSGANPLLHFLSHSVAGGYDPHPWFATEYYYGQVPGLRVAKINGLVHYLTNARENRAGRPNPLFGNAFYLDTYGDVRSSGESPLAHYVTTGAAEGRFASAIHRNLIETLLSSSKSPLVRGQWRNGSVLLISAASSAETMPGVLRLARRLADEYHLEPNVILFRQQEWVRGLAESSKILNLDDFRLACDVLQPAALRMFTASLCRLGPVCAFVDSPEVLATLRAEKVPAYFHYEREYQLPASALEEAFKHARRVIFHYSESFHSAATLLGRYPVNVALRPLEQIAAPRAPKRSTSTSPDAAVPSKNGVPELACRDLNLPELAWNPAGKRTAKTTRKVIIPCCDWSLSGVNSSLEAIGRQLIKLGWDVQIIFTRSEAEIRKTAGADEHLPKLPCRYLNPRNPGMEGMWETLIAELENCAPCILFMGYDFAANGVAAALTDKVGVVGWVQSDDGDYYEQAYRLGRYCNAIVCVSERIKQAVSTLNPSIGDRSLVIYNSSIKNSEIVAKRPRRAEKLRLIYTGRLVEYQKRVLDFIELAKNLDRLKVPYQLTLIGEFSSRENAKELFETRAKAHLADGRIRLPGRMTRTAIMKELTGHDVFLLLSDFEGLPLSLIEAMAAGCVPVVSEMESGIPEVITSGANGFIVCGRDYKKWAAVLRKMWKDRKQISVLSQRARKTVSKRFTVEHVAEQFDHLFQTVAGEICTGKYRRPPSLHWGHQRSHTGDVLPPQSIYRPPMVWHSFGRR